MVLICYSLRYRWPKLTLQTRWILSACLNKQQIIFPNLNLNMIFALCLYQTRLYISGIEHILVWNLRQTIESHTQTHLHTSTIYIYANVFLTYFHSHKSILRCFTVKSICIQNCEFLSRHILARKFKDKNIWFKIFSYRQLILYFQKIISSLCDNEIKDLEIKSHAFSPHAS